MYGANVEFDLIYDLILDFAHHIYKLQRMFMFKSHSLEFKLSILCF